jgi:N-dimethylarginine dimethylaminohydrolase
MTPINQTVLMTGTDFYGIEELNPYSDKTVQPDKTRAAQEHASVKTALEQAGIKVVQIPAPEGCQDGVYTANWALCRGNKAILSSLPNMRTAEQPHAEKALRDLGKTIIKPPYRFSGQGDCLPCGNYLFAGATYRTDLRMHDFIAEQLGYNVISLQTVPELDKSGQPVINQVTGWPDSFFYDIDLALSVITPNLIAWCPAAFTLESQTKIRRLTDVDKIEVSMDEAIQGFACNLVSTGKTVIMSNNAPKLQATIEAHGLPTITPQITELAKGGGYIRCTTLTLDN